MDLSVKAIDGPSKLTTTSYPGVSKSVLPTLFTYVHHTAYAVPGTLSVVLNWTLVIVEASVSVESTSRTVFNLY